MDVALKQHSHKERS